MRCTINNMNDGYAGYMCGCIEVLDNVFIGSNSTILSGVKIGPNAIIGAGSVVTKDVPENSVVAGVPAKVIGKFDEYIKMRKESPDMDEEMAWEKFNEEKYGKN